MNLVNIKDLPKVTNTIGLFSIGVDINNNAYKYDFSLIDKALVSTTNAAEKAENAANAADAARESLTEDLARKADLVNGFVDPTELDPLSGYQTGVIMGKGLFKSTDSRLIPKGKPHTTLLLFTTPSAPPASGSKVLYGEGLGGNTGYGMSVTYTAGGNVRANMRGVVIASRSIPANTLCCVGISYNGSERCIASINGMTTVKENVTYTYNHNPEIFLLGGTEADATAGTLPDFRMIACRRFDFALTQEQLAECWNAGHPERCRVPDVWRNIQPSLWPANNFTQSRRTWISNESGVVRTDDVAASNGFSGAFQRVARDTPGAISAYNAWRINNPATDLKRYQLVEFEYRCDADLRVTHGSTVYATFAANTGQAQKASYVAKAGEYTSIGLVGNTGTFLEVRTLRIQTVGCTLDLVPETLIPTLWRDISGQGIDIPYVPAGTNPTEVSLSYENVEFKDTLYGPKAPAAAPNFIGQTYIDTTNRNIYKAVGTTSAADWKIV